MPQQKAKAEVHTEPIVETAKTVQFEIVRLEPYSTKQPLPKFRERKLSPRYVQLGVYDPTKPTMPIVYYPKVFSRDGIDRDVMHRAIKTFNDIVSLRRNDHRCMGIFPSVLPENS